MSATSGRTRQIEDPPAPETGTASLSRRGLLRSAALVGSAAVIGTACASPRQDRAPRTVGEAGEASAPTGDQLLRRQLERASFGVTPELWSHVGELGLAAWIDEQLALPAHAAEEVPGLAVPVTSGQGAGELDRRSIVEGVAGRVVLHAAFAPDQLRQRLVDALADRLHVSSHDGAVTRWLDEYDQLLRTHALGRYSEALEASARSAAMLRYLDNASSRADGGRRPNENYARELLELHTVGVDGGYDDADVLAVAHVFSGWSLSGGQFLFRPGRHDLGPLRDSGSVLGWRPDAPGESAGRSLLAHLARHPATARRVAHDLARRFVSEQLPADHPVVEDAARVYLAEDTAIGPVVRQLLTDDRFASTATLTARRPLDLVATLLRRAEPVDDPGSLAPSAVRATIALGQLPYGWPAPDGYPWGAESWLDPASLIGRWNLVTTMASPGGGDRPALRWPDLAATRDGAIVAACGPDVQLH